MNSPVPIRSKLPSVGTTIFTVMSRMAAELGAINLSQGFPDFDCDPALVDGVARHMRAGRNQYAPMQGVLPLREAIAAQYAHLHNREYDPDTEVTVTSGGTEAIFAAVSAVLHPGDEAIVLEPCYDSYLPAIELSGGVPVIVRLTYPDYGVDWESVRAAVTPRTRLIFLNSPHNPAGAVLTPADMAALAALVANTNILILSDEVYEHIIFDGVQHESMARHPELAARSFIIGSFGKTYHVTGWKVGYAVAPAALTAEFRKVHQFVTFSTHTPVQYALAEFMQRKEQYLGLAAFYQKKRDYFRERIRESRFTLLPSSGTYFQSVRYDDITDENDSDFAMRLTREHGIAAIPLSAFYHTPPHHKVLRFCFAKTEQTLFKGTEILRSI